MKAEGWQTLGIRRLLHDKGTRHGNNSPHMYCGISKKNLLAMTEFFAATCCMSMNWFKFWVRSLQQSG